MQINEKVNNGKSGLALVALAISYVSFFSLGLDSFIYAYRETFLPKYSWYAFSIAILALCAINRNSRFLPKMPILLWIGFYTLLSITSLTLSISKDVADFGFIIYLYGLAVIIPSAVLFQSLKNLPIDYFKWPLTLVFLLTVGSVVLDYFSPFQYTNALNSGYERTVDRASGFFLNPNAAGISISLTMAMAISYFKMPIRYLFIGLAAVAVLLTFSRAAFLMFVIFLAGFSLRGILPKWFFPGGIIFLAFISILPSFGNFIISVFDIKSTNALSRLELIFGSGSSQSVTADDRFLILMSALDEYMRSPLLGHGLGYSWYWGDSLAGQGTHNMYLRFALDYGVLGFLLWPTFCFAIFMSRQSSNTMWHLVLVLMMCFYGFFTHNALESRSLIIPFMFMLMVDTTRFIESK